MKGKLLNAGLILASFFGYLEWGGGNRIFLWQGEAEVISKLFVDPLAVLHPFIILPMAGQLILVVTLFQKTPNKTLTLLGIAGISILVGFMFIIGLITPNLMILLFTLPFLWISSLTILHHRSQKAEAKN